MNKIKIFVSLTIVSAVMVTGLISALGYTPNNSNTEYGRTIWGNLSKDTEYKVLGNTKFSTNRSNTLTLYIKCWYSQSGGAAGFTQSPRYSVKNTDYLGKSLSAGWGSTITSLEGYHSAVYNGYTQKTYTTGR